MWKCQGPGTRVTPQDLSSEEKVVFKVVGSKNAIQLRNRKHVPCQSIELQRDESEWKFGRTRNAVGTIAADECFHRFFSSSLKLSRTRVFFLELFSNLLFSLFKTLLFLLLVRVSEILSLFNYEHFEHIRGSYHSKTVDLTSLVLKECQLLLPIN